MVPIILKWVQVQHLQYNTCLRYHQSGPMQHVYLHLLESAQQSQMHAWQDHCICASATASTATYYMMASTPENCLLLMLNDQVEVCITVLPQNEHM